MLHSIATVISELPHSPGSFSCPRPFLQTLSLDLVPSPQLSEQSDQGPLWNSEEDITKLIKHDLTFGEFYHVMISNDYTQENRDTRINKGKN